MSSQVLMRSGPRFLAGFTGSCLVGFVLHGADILDPHLAVFQFVSSGAIAGALAAAAVHERRHLMWAVAGMSLVLFLAATRPEVGALLFRDLLYIPTLVASVWLSRVVCAKGPPAPVGQAVAWGLVFAACHAAVSGILTVLPGQSFDLQLGLAAARIGGFVGMGVGLGVAVSARLGRAAIARTGRVP